MRDRLIDDLLNEGFPFVLIGRVPDQRPVNWVNNDNAAVGAMAVEHLLSKGHRRIGLINGSTEMVVTHDRRQGYANALAAAGVPVHPEYVEDGGFTKEGGYRALQRLLSLAEPPTAVFCADDAMAVGALTALRELGRTRTVALVGTNDDPLTALLDPPLSTVRIPVFDLGATFSDFTTKNYVELFTRTKFPLWLKNSTIVAATTGLLQLFLTATAAYAFSRMKFRGRRYGLMVMLLLQMFPSFLSVSAIYFMWAKLNLTDSLLGLILALGGTQAFNIWLLKGYFDNIPRELDEAAHVDGASTWQVFWKILIPLSRPFLAVLFMWTFLGNFTEFLLTSVLNKNPQAYTLALGLRQFVTNQFTTRWTVFAAASVVLCVPLVAIWMYLQKHLIAGLTQGAVKG